jgi:serine protease AprX
LPENPTNEDEAGSDHSATGRPVMRNAIIADVLFEKDGDKRARLGLPADPAAPLPIVIELNIQHASGLQGARDQFVKEWTDLLGDRPAPTTVSDTYVPCSLTLQEVLDLVSVDIGKARPGKPRSSAISGRDRAIYRVWPDFEVGPFIDASVTTVKADAARRAYDASGRNVVWAVIDSGIDELHPHFGTYETLKGEVEQLHRDFTQEDPTQPGALVDDFGHGTHVAGIIAGGLKPDQKGVRVVERMQDPSDPSKVTSNDREVEPELLRGVAPHTKLVSLKVLDGKGKGKSMNIVRALEYVRREVNGQSKLMRIHGVNLSVGYEFDARWFACGQSPLCVEVDRLVRSGVSVVVAAGNTGYGTLGTVARQTNVGITMTINDPGNAALAITVGATHRDMPHTYGVSYFSSKGPTGDGRLKPDLVAPGERITSAAAGKAFGEFGGSPKDALYVEDSGTSMAAPHVSGAISAFLSIRREFIGQPEQIKAIFATTATSLGREPYFQGGGLVDLMRAIQSV